jgi:hypothetical protein
VTYQSASLSSLPNINYIPKDIIDDEIKSWEDKITFKIKSENPGEIWWDGYKT